MKRQGKFVDTNTEPNAYHSERPAAKKGVFHQTRGGKLERPKHQAADGTGSLAEQIRNRPSENRLLESQS